MDKNAIDHDRSILSAVLHEWGRCGSVEDGVETRVVIDRDSDTYLLQSIGWQNDQRIFHTAFHARIVNDSLWIEWDGTHPSLTLELQHRGVPRERIVLGWLHPAMRQPSGGPAPDSGHPRSAFSGGVWQLNVRRRYQTILKAVLREYEALEGHGIPETLKTRYIYDNEHADYLLISVGLDRRRGHHSHGLIFHAWVERDKVWIGCDNVSPGISQALIERGIPERDVLSAFGSSFAPDDNTPLPSGPSGRDDIPSAARLATYRAIIQEVLQRYSAAPSDHVALFDTRLDRYAVWMPGEVLLYLDIVGGTVRIHVDRTRDGVGRTLAVLGIAEADIAPVSPPDARRERRE